MITRTLLILSAAGLALGGCDGDDNAAATKPAAPATAPAAYGVYTREVTEADLARTKGERNDAPGFEPSPTGRYQLTLAKGQGIDVVKVTDPSGFTVAMDGRVDEAELRIAAYSAPEQGAFCDQAIAAQAKYALTVEGDDVELAPTTDDCADRDSVLTGVWTKG